MNLSKLIISSLVFLGAIARAQLSVDYLEYKHRISKSNLYLRDSLDFHSGVLPLISDKQISPTGVPVSKNTGNSSLLVYPLADLGVGVESMTGTKVNFPYNLGLGAGVDFRAGKKFILTGKLMPYWSQPGYVGDSIRSAVFTDPGTTRPIVGQLFQRSELLFAYRPHRIFTFLGGYGKNFFGEGYRSLLLSDNASSYPFLKLETSFGGIKYVNLYTIWNDNSVNPSDKSLDRMKFSSIHFLSWNITREFNLSVFESVVWQAKDTLVNRGFDINYLNPVVFYRPVEYASGSADNVLLGLNLSYKINKHHCIYGQVIIDEFLLSKIKDKSQWWGNKYGFQLGYKTNQFFVSDLYSQMELNMVRPFTYSHKNSVQNYGHLNASVTHPVGANFYELVHILSYPFKKSRLTNKMTFLAYGTDTDSINQGQNIFISYSYRGGDYGHKTMQGLRTDIFNEQLVYETPLFQKLNLYLTFTYNYRLAWTSEYITHNHFVLVGLKSRLWNSYTDF